MATRKCKFVLLGLLALSFGSGARAQIHDLLATGLGGALESVRTYFGPDDACLSPQANLRIKRLNLIPITAGVAGSYAAHAMAPGALKPYAAVLGAEVAQLVAEGLIQGLQLREQQGATRDLMLLGGKELVCVTLDAARTMRQPVVAEFQAFVVQYCELPGAQLGEIDDFLAMTKCVEASPLLRARAAKYLADMLAINRAHCLVAQEGLHGLARNHLERQMRATPGGNVQQLDIPHFDCDSTDTLRELYGPLLANEVASLQ